MLRFFKKKNRGQNVAEYAILIALVVGAVIAMQKFVQRGLQGRVRDATQYMVQGTNELGNTAQYEPYYQDSQYETQKSDRETKFGNGDIEQFATGSSSNRMGASNTLIGVLNQEIGNGMEF
jgi:Flp pilus assembly pilin Flp